jgi:hypothetical protein
VVSLHRGEEQTVNLALKELPKEDGAPRTWRATLKKRADTLLEISIEVTKYSEDRALTLLE